MDRRTFLRLLGSAALGSACGQQALTTGHPTPAAPTGAPRAVGGRLLDAAGRRVTLTGVNWFGFETSVFAPHGLWSRGWQDMLDQIAGSGFNAIRLPFSNQLLDPGTVPTSIDFNKNPDLRGLTGLQVMDKVIEGAGRRGLRVLLDRHRPTADVQSELWYTDRISEQRWVDDWVLLANRYRNQEAVIGADLHNEPHGPASWGDGNPKTDWRLAAEQAGNAVLAANPDWLIVVEGIERYAGDAYWWGGNLRGARAAPVRLSRPEKLVYSAHDYGPEVYAQPWFADPGFPRNLEEVWRQHWAYLPAEGIAPVLLGEFGGRSVGSDPEGVWQRTLVGFLKANQVGYAYWAWNPDSGDTGGILKDDWQTVDRAKLDLLATYQAPPLGRLGAG